MSCKVLVPIADGSEDIETSVITDVLIRAGITVLPLSVMPHEKCKMARELIFFLPSTLEKYIKEHHSGDVDAFASSLDAVLLPGGMPGANHLRDCAILTSVMKSMRSKYKLIGAICASPAVALAKHGFIHKGAKVTCFPKMQGALEEAVPGVHFVKDAVAFDEENGPLLTSQGPGTAFAFSLCAVSYLLGHEKAIKVNGDLLVHHEKEIQSIPHRKGAL